MHSLSLILFALLLAQVSQVKKVFLPYLVLLLKFPLSFFHCPLIGRSHATFKHFQSLSRPVWVESQGWYLYRLFLCAYENSLGRQLLHLPSTGHENIHEYYLSPFIPRAWDCQSISRRQQVKCLQIHFTLIESLISTNTTDLTPSHTWYVEMFCTYLISSTFKSQ